MSYNPDIHHRRSVRLREYDYAQAGLYFITICVQNHKCVFGNIVNDEIILNEYGRMANDCWLEIPQHYQNVVLHEFVIMPNHIHGILEIADVGVEYFRPDNETGNKRVENIRPLRRPNCEPGTIGAIVRGFKIGVTKQIGYSIWQRNYHEHIIRNQNRHAIIVDYINNNPAKWENDRFYAN
ncbi:MAG: transposase [Prevotellaceae bacterium]|jgi:REP element-mobilizing transposase RayT|nr:transposase [Prevotellaceae bacterium]